jgi:hypothetical protein
MLTTDTLHHTFSHYPEARISRERCRLAKRLERMTAGNEGHTRAPRFRPLVDPVVASSCAAPAASIAVVLRDWTQPVQADLLDDIRWFVTDGCDSPLFGRDAAAALLAISEIERSVSAGRAAVARTDRVPS